MQGKTLSASLVGLAAFVSKFGQSLAPMLAYSVLPSPAGLPAHAAAVGRYGAPAARDAIWRLLLTIPTITATTQLALWLGVYQLRGQYLRNVKVAVAGSIRGNDDDDDGGAPAKEAPA